MLRAFRFFQRPRAKLASLPAHEYSFEKLIVPFGINEIDKTAWIIGAVPLDKERKGDQGIAIKADRNGVLSRP